MTDFILQNDPLEFQNTRQSTKITFLQQEVEQLQDHIADLEHVVKINKQALKIATAQQAQAQSKPKHGALNDTTASTIDLAQTKDAYKNLQQLYEQMQEENIKLLEIVDKVKKERNIAQSKALISEQICEEAQRHEGEAVAELEEKIYELRKLLQDKEYAIQELEKVKPVAENEGIVIKYRDVMNPTEQNLKLHNEIDSLNGMLTKVTKELNKVQNDKKDLLAINFGLASELAKIKATLSNPMNGPHKFGFLAHGYGTDLNNSVGDFGGYFKPAMEFNESGDSGCNSPVADKKPKGYPQGGKAPVPKLDLTKAIKIQDALANKINQAMQQNAQTGAQDPKLLEKMKHLEAELDVMKKRLSHEMINNRLLNEEIARVHREKTIVAAANDILIKANKRYEEKWQKIFYTLEFYKEYYHKYMDIITKGHMTHMKTISTQLPGFEKLQQMNKKFNIEHDSSPDQLIRELKKADEDEGKHVNVSILDAQEDEEEQFEEEQPHSPKKENIDKNNNVFEFTKDQCKYFLLNLAKDLYVNTNINKSSVAKNILRKLEFGRKNPTMKPAIRLKRSVSNPLDYVSERRKLIFEPRVQNKDNNVTKLKKEAHKARLADDQNEDLMKNKNVRLSFGKSSAVLKEESPKKGGGFQGYNGDEMISFTVDAEEFNKKMADVSFISNNDILEQIKYQ